METLAQLRADASAALRQHFPQMRDDEVKAAAKKEFPSFTTPTLPPPRSRQLAFGDDDDTVAEGQAC